MSQLCLRCREGKTNFPHPRNPLVCGTCLHILHENHRKVEEALTVRGI